MRLGTRRSALALAQAELVAGLLGGAEIVPMAAGGDDDGAPARDADKSRWVRELERALIDGEIDIAVHSAKDLPGELADGLELLGAPERAPAHDVLCGAAGLADLPSGARVGTSSLRRAAQLRAARADLEPVALAGNVDTRLRKLADPGQGLDAIVIAQAGLVRLGREGEAGAVLDGELFVPAPGQGVLALEGRSGDTQATQAARSVTDALTLACLRAERALARELQASCNTALGAYASPAAGGGLCMRAWVGLPDGSEWVCDELAGTRADPEGLGSATARRLALAGGGELLRRAEEMTRAAPA